MRSVIRMFSIAFATLLLSLLVFASQSVQAAILTVSTTADVGAGSLRQAIIDATSNPAADDINFNIPLTDPGYNSTTDRFTITLVTPLADLPLGATTINNTMVSGVTVEGNSSFRIFTLVNSAVVNINNLTISQGGSGGSSGGLGGGIYMGDSATLTLTNCIVSNNTATNDGGGIYINDSGTLNITSSTVSGNTATVGDGGGIYNDVSGTMNATNITINGNTAGDQGGGIHNFNATANVNSSTISGNAATNGGGIFNNFTATLNNSLVALNTAPSGPDLSGTFTGNDNLISNADGSAGFGPTTNQLGSTASPINPRLGPLQDNGGPTFTQALFAGSPAIDRGATALATDQRGVSRPQDGDCGRTNNTVTVDFAAPRTGVKSVSGFLHSVQALYPSAGTVTPLHSALWRVTAADRFYPDPQNGWPQLFDRLQSIGTQVQLVLSDGWGYPPKVQPPYTNWPAWENYVRDVARANKRRSMSYDVWNEPNIPEFWQGNREQFFETYVRAYRVLREELGATVEIGGPSLADTYDKKYIKAFLDYCLANSPCEVNFLSWHELDPRESSPLGISNRLKDARKSFVNAAAYRPLRIGAIYINESVGRFSHLRPGDVLMYLSQMEAGAVDGACRTCWPDSSGVNDCFNNSLDGLLDPQTGSRRPVWWTYKAYADGVTSRVAATSTNSRIAVLASTAAADSLSPQILLSYFNNRTDTPATVNINVALKNVKSLAQFSNTDRLRIKIEVLPLNGSGESPLVSPLTLEERDITTNGGSVMLFLPKISAGSAYQITLGGRSNSRKG